MMRALVVKTKALLDRLAADPALGINRIVDAAEVAQMGGSPVASFWIDFKPGYAMGSGRTMVSVSPVKGTHGYFPEHPEMRAAFFAAGPGVAEAGRNRRNQTSAISPPPWQGCLASRCRPQRASRCFRRYAGSPFKNVAAGYLLSDRYTPDPADHGRPSTELMRPPP